LDLFIDAMQQIARKVEENPQMVLDAPHETRVSRLDETTAARKPILRWKAQAAPTPLEPESAANTPLEPDTAAKEW
ncbi:MAG: hypothetical protein ACR2JE_14050, partial [Acidobacteriaceae bacterium]